MVRVYFDNNDYHTPRYTTKVIANKIRFQADKNDDYPDTMVFFETDEGEYFKINRKTLTSTYKHASGTMITIDKDGNINIDNKFSGGAAGNLIIGIEGNVNLSVEGSVDIESAGEVNINSTGSSVNLGHNLTDNFVNNLPNCLVTGAPHALQANVKA